MWYNLCRHWTMNDYHYGNIFPLIQSVLDREIQGLSFDVWYTVEITVCELNVNWSFCLWICKIQGFQVVKIKFWSKNFTVPHHSFSNTKYMYFTHIFWYDITFSLCYSLSWPLCERIKCCLGQQKLAVIHVIQCLYEISQDHTHVANIL